jgi:hypothetical protein
MSDHNDQQIDSQIGSMIRGHLSSELDRHVGAASRRFSDVIASQHNQRAIATTPLLENSPRRNQAGKPKFGSFWSIGLVGTALAATMTIVAMRHTSPASRTSPLNRGGNGGGTVLTDPNAMGVEPVVYPGEVNVKWKTIDQGIVRMPDGSMARKMLRQTTDKRTWKDPKTKRTYEYIQPQEETVYVGLKQY